MMKKGFTLLEMVVVVLIVAVLLLLTIPNVQKVIDVVQEKGCDGQLKIVDTAIIEYMMIYGSNPSSINSLISEGLLLEEQTTCQNGRNITISNGQATLQ